MHDFEVLHVFGFLDHGHRAHRLLFLLSLTNLLRNLLGVVNFNRAVVLDDLLRWHGWSESLGVVDKRILTDLLLHLFARCLNILLVRLLQRALLMAQRGRILFKETGGLALTNTLVVLLSSFSDAGVLLRNLVGARIDDALLGVGLTARQIALFLEFYLFFVCVQQFLVQFGAVVLGLLNLLALLADHELLAVGVPSLVKHGRGVHLA